MDFSQSWDAHKSTLLQLILNRTEKQNKTKKETNKQKKNRSIWSTRSSVKVMASVSLAGGNESEVIRR